MHVDLSCEQPAAGGGPEAGAVVERTDIACGPASKPVSDEDHGRLNV